jgi:hypothetical protein
MWSYFTSVQLTGAFSRMRSLTSRSTSSTCCGVSGALLKSNVSLSGPHIRPFLHRVAADHFMQGPVQQVRDSVMALNGFPPRTVHGQHHLLPTAGASASPAAGLQQMQPGVARFLRIAHPPELAAGAQFAVSPTWPPISA